MYHQIFGVLFTISGIEWVVSESNSKTPLQKINKQKYSLGILFGFGAASGQALGLVTAKIGLTGEFPALTGTLMRMLVAAIILWSYTILQRQAKNTLEQLYKHKKASIYILGGSITGPFLGLTLSLLAIQYTEVGIASTLMALTPIFLLPVGYLVFDERYGWQTVLGTLIAIVGVSMLFVTK